MESVVKILAWFSTWSMMASWWPISFRTLFRTSTTLNWTILSLRQQEWCRSIWFFYKLSEKVSFVDLQRWEQGFWCLNRYSQSKIWNLWTTLKRQHGFHGNQSSVRRLIFGQAFRKTLLEWILRRGTGVLLGGGGTKCPRAPLVFGAQKKPGWDSKTGLVLSTRFANWKLQ